MAASVQVLLTIDMQATMVRRREVPNRHHPPRRDLLLTRIADITSLTTGSLVREYRLADRRQAPVDGAPLARSFQYRYADAARKPIVDIKMDPTSSRHLRAAKRTPVGSPTAPAAPPPLSERLTALELRRGLQSIRLRLDKEPSFRDTLQ